MAITFDTEKYLAKIDFTEAELDRLCVKKAEVIGVSSRQSVKILCEGVEYEDVPVWIHTDCGARHWYLKGLEAVEEDQEPPIAPTAAEYFKDAALMFPFPGGAYIKSGGSEFQTITPYVLVVFTVTEEATTPRGVINILENIVDNPDRDPYKTYRPFLRFRFRHTSSIGGGDILHSRTYLYDLIEEKVASVPTWNFATESWELPFKNLEDIEDIDVDKELDIFTSGAPHIPEARLRLTSLTSEHHGTDVYGRDALYPYQNQWGISTCDGETLSPGWGGTYTPAGELSAGQEYDFSCNCGFGTIYGSALRYQDQSFHTEITHFSQAKNQPDGIGSMANMENYATFSLGRYRQFTYDSETEWIPSGGGCGCGYQSGYQSGSTSVRYRAELPDQDPFEFVLENTKTNYYEVAPYCPSNSLESDGISCRDLSGQGFLFEKDISGKIWFEVGATLRGNFFLEGDTVNILQVATYTRHAELFTMHIFDLPYPVIENNVHRVAFDGYTGRGFLENGPVMNYIAGVVADYHEVLGDSEYFNNLHDAGRASLGDQMFYHYMQHPETIKLEVTLQGLYFVPFNREIALLEEP
jgi:hypothetical protein